MNCSDFETQIDDFTSNKLDVKARQRMIEHKAQCSACSQSLQQHMDYLTLLSSWQEPELQEATKRRILSKLETQTLHRNSRGRNQTLMGFASGFAAASLFAVGLFVSGQFLAEPSDLASLIEQDPIYSQEITLVINVPSDMPNAELKLSLPAELSVVGEEYLSNITVPVSLKQGRNSIVIPVQLEEFAIYANDVIVDASLIYKNSKTDFAFGLDQYLDLDTESHPPQGKDDELIYNDAVILSNKTV